MSRDINGEGQKQDIIRMEARQDMAKIGMLWWFWRQEGALRKRIDTVVQSGV